MLYRVHFLIRDLTSSFNILNKRVYFVFSIPFQYLGDWYEIYKFEASFEGQQRCIRANYQMKEDGHIRVQNTGIECVLHFICFFTIVRNRLTSMCSYKDVQYVHLLLSCRDGKSITAIGDGYAPDKNVPAKLEVRFSDSKFEFNKHVLIYHDLIFFSILLHQYIEVWTNTDQNFYLKRMPILNFIFHLLQRHLMVNTGFWILIMKITRSSILVPILLD